MKSYKALKYDFQVLEMDDKNNPISPFPLLVSKVRMEIKKSTL